MVEIVGIGSFYLTSIIITILVLKINHFFKCEVKNKSRSWDIIEWFVATIFGIVGLIYILITYSHEIFSFNCSKRKKKKSEEKVKDTANEYQKDKVYI